MTAADAGLADVLQTAVRHAASVTPRRVAVVDDDGQFDCLELLAWVEECRTALRGRSGDTVLMRIPSSRHWVGAIIAAAQEDVGVAVVLAGSTEPEIAEIVTESGASSALRVDARGAPRLEGLQTQDRGAFRGFGLHQRTSGSTGAPTTVWRPARVLLLEARGVASALALGRDDRLFATTPLGHSFGSALCFASLVSGAAIAVTGKLDGQRLTAVAEVVRPTVLAGVPYTFRLLCRPRLDLSAWASLRMALCGGAAVTNDLAVAVEASLGVPLTQEYGLTEVGVLTVNVDGSRTRRESVGTVVPGVEIEIVETGTRLQVGVGVDGDVMARHTSPPGDPVSAWTDTGDIGHQDTEGRVYVTGRKKLMVNVGGVAVAPREVEKVLLASGRLEDVLVTGESHAVAGESLVAFVVPADRLVETSAELVSLLYKWMRERLSDVKVPRRLVVLDEFPRTPSGKMDAVALRSANAREVSPS